MKRYFWVILCAPITLYALFLVMYTQMIKSMGESTQDEYLNAVANYCADAATAEMLLTADLGLDYQNTGEVTVDPELAVQEYGAMLAIAQGLQPTQEVIQDTLRQYVKVLYVCGYDGYYVYQNELTDAGEYNLVGTFKMPYTYTNGTDLYALTLNGNKCWKLSVTENGATLKRKQSSGLAPELANSVINKRISVDMNTRITNIYKAQGNGWSNRVFIPASMSNFTSVNPVTSPTVLAFVDGLGGTTSFGIGGSKIVNTRNVAGYIGEDGIKYYCYADLLPDAMLDSGVITQMFDTCDEAAIAGYHFDPHYMK